MLLRHAALSAAFLLTLAACGGSSNKSSASGSPTMRPGEDCLGCHHEFTAAGTVYASASAGAAEGISGVQVIIDDGTRVITMTSNSAGNFYTTAGFAYGSGTSVQVVGANTQMTTRLANSGFAGCNSCHSPAGQGRVHKP